MNKRKIVLFFCLIFLSFATIGHAQEMDESLVRIIHASPDAPALDVYVNGNLVLEALEYSDVSEYIVVPSTAHTVTFNPAGDTKTTLVKGQLTAKAGAHYTLAAIGELEEIHLATLNDEKEVSDAKSKVRIAHFSPDATALELATPIGNELFKEIIFSKVTDYIELDAGMHTFQLHVAGTDDVLVSLNELDMKEGSVYTAVAIGRANGSPKFEVMFLMDYMPTPNAIPKTGLGGASSIR